jgi:hypothetical protein
VLGQSQQSNKLEVAVVRLRMEEAAKHATVVLRAELEKERGGGMRD